MAVMCIEDDHGTTHQFDFLREGWKLPENLRAQFKFDPLMVCNRHEKFVWEVRIQGRETNEVCGDHRVTVCAVATVNTSITRTMS